MCAYILYIIKLLAFVVRRFPGRCRYISRLPFKRTSLHRPIRKCQGEMYNNHYILLVHLHVYKVQRSGHRCSL